MSFPADTSTLALQSTEQKQKKSRWQVTSNSWKTSQSIFTARSKTLSTIFRSSESEKSARHTIWCSLMRITQESLRWWFTLSALWSRGPTPTRWITLTSTFIATGSLVKLSGLTSLRNSIPRQLSQDRVFEKLGIFWVFFQNLNFWKSYISRLWYLFKIILPESDCIQVQNPQNPLKVLFFKLFPQIRKICFAAEISNLLQ